MPTGKDTVAFQSLRFKGDYSEQDQWKEHAVKAEELKRKCKTEFEEILSFTDKRSGEETFENYERALIERIFRLGRLLIALFLCLWEERTPCGLIETKGKERYRRQPSKPRLLGTFFGKVRYWRSYLFQENGKRGAGYYPIDLALGLTADGFCLGILSRAVRLATKMSYAASAVVMESFLGWSPSIKTIEEATQGFGRHTSAYVEQRPAPVNDGEVLVVQVDSKAIPTALAEELKKRRGKRQQNPLSDSPRHRGRNKRKKKAEKNVVKRVINPRMVKWQLS